MPNTVVKPFYADGTELETAWESRWLPDSTRTFVRAARAVLAGFFKKGNGKQKQARSMGS